MTIKGIEGRPESADSERKKSKEQLTKAQLDQMDPDQRAKYEQELADAEAEKTKEQQKVVDETQNDAKVLKSAILADLDNNGYGGTEVKKGKNARYNRLRDKQDQIDQDQKDLIDDIYKKTDLSHEDQELLVNFINKGVLKGVAFKKGMEQMYMQRTGANKAEAQAWVADIKSALDDAGLWDSVKEVNRKEKKQDRIEKRAQKKTYENQKEVVFTEHELKKMIDITSKMMGRDVFAEALYTKLSEMPSAREMRGDFPEWHNVKELNAVLADADNAELIRSMLVKALPYMTVTNFQEWLLADYAGTELENYKNEIEAKYGEVIDAKVKKVLENLPSELSLDPAATQNVHRKLHTQIVAGLAAGYVNTPHVIGTGIGAGINMGKLFVGVGVGSNGMPGFVVGVGEQFNLGKNTKASIRGGLANFIIPFARVDIQQNLNTKALEKTLTAKRLWKAGVYAEATVGYVGAGINVGSDLEGGINHQASSIQKKLKEELGNINGDMGLEEVKAELRNIFTKADEKTLDQVAEHVLYGLENGYSLQDIASTFAAAWKNEAIIHSKGKVDFSAELGVGALFGIPVLKAFLGLKIYTRSTKREDKFDKEAKEKKMSAFSGFNKFDNADTQDLSYAEKIEYWLGNKYLVEEDGDLITISKNTEGDTPIYDQLDVFVKDPTLVEITKDSITFNKGMNIMAGKFVGAYKDKQKVYIGYDLEDKKVAKTPVNYQLAGTPEDYENTNNTETETSETETLHFEFYPEVDPVDELRVDTLINNKGAHAKFIEMTNPTNKQRVAYNKAFGKFVDSTASMDFDLMKQNIDAINKDFLHIFNDQDQKDLTALWEKDDNCKRLIVNRFLQAGSFSARLAAIIDHKGLPGSKNVGELLKNRKGHVDAFKNSGIAIDPHAFDGIYNKAKNLGMKGENYSEEPHINAVALVGYYRQGLAPTTGFIGFGGVTTVKGEKYREDASAETGVYDKFLEIYQKSADFAAQKEKIKASIKKFDANADMSDEQLLELIKTGTLTINGMEITMTGNAFEKILNAPCANEGYMLSFGDLEITYSKKEKTTTPGDIYVGMAYTENYQSANSFKLGVGAAWGKTPPQPRTPDVPPPPPPPKDEDGTPGSNPVDISDTPTTKNDNNGDITVINDGESDEPGGEREP